MCVIKEPLECAQLLPCLTATIHKVHGLSLDAAIINLGFKVFEDGIAYVALSRVKILALLELVAKLVGNMNNNNV